MSPDLAPPGRPESAFVRGFHDRSLRYAQTVLRWPVGEAPTAEELLAELFRFPVLLTANSADVESAVGQDTLLLAANLLARMFPIVLFEIPEAALVAVRPLSSIASPSLPGYVLDLACSICPFGDFRLLGLTGDTESLADLVVGQGGQRRVGMERFRVHATGRGWRALTGVGLPYRNVQECGNSLGGLVSAAFAAMEMYKAFLRNVALRRYGRRLPPNLAIDLEPVTKFSLSLLDYGRDIAGSDGPDLPPRIDLGRVLLISAGAMANSAIYGLRVLGRVFASGDVVEPKLLDGPDLNRYVLMLATDLGKPKGPVLAERALPSLRLEAENTSYQQSTARSGGSSVDLTLVGVDHPPSRVAVQRDNPRLIVNAATEGRMAYVSRHSLEHSGSPCLECFNEHAEEGVCSADEPIATLAPTSAIAGLLQASEVIKSTVPLLRAYRLRTQVEVNTIRPDLQYSIRTGRMAPRANCHCQRGSEPT